MDARVQSRERADAIGPTIHDTPERLLLRDQVARFVAREVEPHGDMWERTSLHAAKCDLPPDRQRALADADSLRGRP